MFHIRDKGRLNLFSIISEGEATNSIIAFRRGCDSIFIIILTIPLWFRRWQTYHDFSSDYYVFGTLAFRYSFYLRMRKWWLRDWNAFVFHKSSYWVGVGKKELIATREEMQDGVGLTQPGV